VSRTVILLPYRPDGGWRDKLWAHCRSVWAERFPDWPIYVGEHLDGPFNRAAALNRAATLADADGHWDVALLIDGDVICDPRSIAEAVRTAPLAGRLVVAHDERVMLNRAGTVKVLKGYTGSWRTRDMVERVWYDSVSCAVAVGRPLWDAVGGFDELFVGWGREDTAFRIACEAHGGPILRVSGETFHLWHEVAPETAAQHPLRKANEERHQRYVQARWNLSAVQALQREVLALDLPETRIPRILHRTLPEVVDPAVEARWAHLQELHPGWEFRTHREPLDPKDWPLTGDLFGKCDTGAQKAGLIRLECLVRDGGFYCDADIVGVRSLEPLLQLDAVAAWEDDDCVPDAFLGSIPGHPAFVEMIERARASVLAGEGAWKSGPGVTTAVLPGRTDVLLLPPTAAYPCHYLEMSRMDAVLADPPSSTFVVHLYEHSWGTPEEKALLKRKQRT
jgi:hypothetical protein